MISKRDVRCRKLRKPVAKPVVTRIRSISLLISEMLFFYSTDFSSIRQCCYSAEEMHRFIIQHTKCIVL